MLTKKHYNAIADILLKQKERLENANREQIEHFANMIIDFCDYFERDNPKFNRQQFKESMY